MNILAQALVDGLMFLEQAVGATVTWPYNTSTTYPAVGGAETISKTLDIAGMKIVADAPIVIRTAAFAEARPAEKQQIKFSSAEGVAARTYRIDGITYLHGEIMILHCNESTKGG